MPQTTSPVRRRRRLTQRAAYAVLACSLLVVTSAGVAGAATGRSHLSEYAAAHRVLGAKNPVAAYHRLNKEDRATFRRAFRHQQMTTTTGPALRVSATGDVDGPDESTQPGGGSGGAGCWQKYVYHEWHDFGIHDGNSWIQLNWCNDLYGKVTSQSVTNAGGQGLGGVGYGGVIGSGSRVISSQVRAFREFKFTLAGVSANPCLQIRGNAGGSSSTLTTCNLS